MGINSPKTGAPGTTDQSPRWEGPQETRPSGYLPAKDNPDIDRDAVGENNLDPNRDSASDVAKTKDSNMANPEDDAKGQYAPSQGDRKATGVASAKPTVITGSEDATVHRDPPGAKPQKDFDLNYDPAEMNEGSFRGSR